MAETIAFHKVAVDSEQRLVFGLASVSAYADGELLTDHQDHQIEPAELERAFYEYAAVSGEGDEMHDREMHSVLVESFVVTGEKLEMLLKAVGCDADVSGFQGVAAWVGYKVLDEGTWQRVKSGELKAFSIEGEAVREEVP